MESGNECHGGGRRPPRVSSCSDGAHSKRRGEERAGEARSDVDANVKPRRWAAGQAKTSAWTAARLSESRARRHERRGVGAAAKKKGVFSEATPHEGQGPQAGEGRGEEEGRGGRGRKLLRQPAEAAQWGLRGSFPDSTREESWAPEVQRAGPPEGE